MADQQSPQRWALQSIAARPERARVASSLQQASEATALAAPTQSARPSSLQRALLHGCPPKPNFPFAPSLSGFSCTTSLSSCCSILAARHQLLESNPFIVPVCMGHVCFLLLHTSAFAASKQGCWLGRHLGSSSGRPIRLALHYCSCHVRHLPAALLRGIFCAADS
jgi:hypothetical protein